MKLLIFTNVVVNLTLINMNKTVKLFTKATLATTRKEALKILKKAEKLENEAAITTADGVTTDGKCD